MIVLANLSAWVWWPARLHGLYAGGEGSSLVIEREILELDCTRAEPCSFSARYVVHNPQAAEARVTAALFARYARTREIVVDGVPSGRPLEETEWRQLVDSTQQVMPGWPWPGKKKCTSCPIPLERHGLDLVLPAGATSEVVVRGILEQSDQPNELVYELAPIRSWGNVRQIEVVVRATARQKVRVGTFETFDPTGHPTPSPASCTTSELVTRCLLMGEGRDVPSWLHVDLGR
jgi:hypothetical protein